MQALMDGSTVVKQPHSPSASETSSPSFELEGGDSSSGEAAK